jgi:hypothetical protein
LFNFQSVTCTEVQRIIMAMPSNKSPGPDKIGMRVFKDCLPIILGPLAYAYDKFLSNDKHIPWPMEDSWSYTPTKRRRPRDSLKQSAFLTTHSHYRLADSQLADSQLADSQLADSQLAHSQLAHSQLAHSQLAHSQLADSQLADSQLADSQTRRLADSQTRRLADSQTRRLATRRWNSLPKNIRESNSLSSFKRKIATYSL